MMKWLFEERIWDLINEDETVTEKASVGAFNITENMGSINFGNESVYSIM